MKKEENKQGEQTTGQQPEQQKAKKKIPVKKLVITALLAALVAVLQIWFVIPVGAFNITLSLIPIVVGAILLGWQYGAALGAVLGIVVSILSITGRDPGGLMVFQTNAVLGWILCVLKSTAAGAASGLVYRAFLKFKHASYVFVAVSGVFLFLSGFGVASLVHFEKAWQTTLLVLCVSALAALYMILAYRALSSQNTAVFLAAMTAPVCNTGIFIIGMSLFYSELLKTWANGTNVALFIIAGIVGVNFLIEFSVSVILAPAIATIVKTAKKTR